MHRREEKMGTPSAMATMGGPRDAGRPGQRLFIEAVPLDNITGTDALRYVEHNGSRVDGRAALAVLFVNVHSLHLARRRRSLMHSLQMADLVLPDGSGLALAGKMLGYPIGENLNGTDFSPRVLELACERHWSVFLLGGRNGVAERCRDILAAKLPGLDIAGTYHGHFSDAEEPSIIEEINRVKPDLLFVALGSPLQEEWIMEHVGSLAVGMCFGVGGLFDFLAGEKRRAPRWLRRAGLEWVFRFVVDPASKWDRVLVEIPLYVLRVVVARLFKKPMVSTKPPFYAENHGEA